MEVISSPDKMQQKALSLKGKSKTISCVPTMGFLHEGHLNLIRAARADANILVVTIFVNPAQFGPSEDLSSYPRDLKRDLSLCEQEGVDIVFTPEAEDIYPEGYSTYIEENDLSKGLCGATRPGHFRGVATVVAKLFNIVQPDSSFFGRKDYQQLCVIKKMVKDLNIPIRIIGCPIVREEDGLAMSSRNKNLNSDQRREALCLRQALLRAKELVGTGEKGAAVIRESMVEIIEKEPSSRIDYIEIRDGETLELKYQIEEGTMIALAVFIGKTRLIDNILI